jgi:pyruvate formate lyase activating enzyme
MDMIRKMCDWLYDNDLYDFPLHFSRFHPLHKLTNLPQTPRTSLENARQVALESGIKFVYLGNLPGTDANNTYCPACKELLIERKGYTLTQYHLTDNSCGYCGETIPGHWQ